LAKPVATDPDREFWLGMRSTYIQQIRLIRDRFEINLHQPDGALAAGVCTSLMNAIAAIERRFGVAPWTPA